MAAFFPGTPEKSFSRARPRIRGQTGGKRRSGWRARLAVVLAAFLAGALRAAVARVAVVFLAVVARAGAFLAGALRAGAAAPAVVPLASLGARLGVITASLNALRGVI